MGKAARWFKGLLGMKKDKENVDNSSNSGDRKDKKRWSFAKSGGKDSPVISTATKIPASDSSWMRSYISESEKEQTKHAIAVAAATAAAADAAVAAAQAAVAVVRLTSHGRGTMFSGGRERWAAVKIQTVFRAHLARKALRALRGLVKLQALVRGFLVRKRATATLFSMQALFRAQSAARSHRARRSFNKDQRFQQEIRHRKSLERFDHEPRSEFHSKRLSASYESTTNSYEESPKIVEVDTYKSNSRSRRIYTCASDSGEESHHQYNMSSSPLPCRPIPTPAPARLTIPECRHLHDYEWGFVTDDCKFPTAQSTPRFASSGRANHLPGTPAKSVCGDGYFRPYSYYPSYMSNTQSSKAKVRAQSAPKQRPEPGPKKRLSLNEIMASRTSLSGVKMQRSCSQAQEVVFDRERGMDLHRKNI